MDKRVSQRGKGNPARPRVKGNPTRERGMHAIVIKPGMDTEQVIARFEAERQAPALMDHPNIAKVFDASSTENGRPSFSMELVK